jgi:hypothetical protein
VFPQGELPKAVKVSVTLPAEISPGLGVYVHDAKEFAFANVPVPLDVQVILDWLVALEPAVILNAPNPTQVVSLGPATAVGVLLEIVNVFVEVAAGQLVWFAVKVNVT